MPVTEIHVDALGVIDSLIVTHDVDESDSAGDNVIDTDADTAPEVVSVMVTHDDVDGDIKTLDVKLADFDAYVGDGTADLDTHMLAVCENERTPETLDVALESTDDEIMTDDDTHGDSEAISEDEGGADSKPVDVADTRSEVDGDPLSVMDTEDVAESVDTGPLQSHDRNCAQALLQHESMTSNGHRARLVENVAAGDDDMELDDDAVLLPATVSN